MRRDRRGQTDGATTSQERLLTHWPNNVVAWSNHDPAGIAGAFLPEGYLRSPATGRLARGEAIAQYAGGTCAAFPDFRLEIVQRNLIVDQAVIDE